MPQVSPDGIIEHLLRPVRTQVQSGQGGEAGNVLHTVLRFPSCGDVPHQAHPVRPHLALDAGEHRRHAAQPQRADRLAEPELDVEVVRDRQDVGRRLPVQARAQDRREPARGGGLRWGREEQVHPPVTRGLDLDRQEERRLALGNLFHRRRGVRVAVGQLGQLLRQLEQQLQPIAGARPPRTRRPARRAAVAGNGDEVIGPGPIPARCPARSARGRSCPTPSSCRRSCAPSRTRAGA